MGESIGYVVFIVSGGIVDYSAFTLYKTKEAAVAEAAAVVEGYRIRDRYANPEHRCYDPQFAEEKKEEYCKRLERVALLRGTELTDEDDLVIMEILSPQTEG